MLMQDLYMQRSVYDSYGWNDGVLVKNFSLVVFQDLIKNS